MRAKLMLVILAQVPHCELILRFCDIYAGTSTVNSPATAKNCLSVGATQTSGEIARSREDSATAVISINNAETFSFPLLISTFSPSFSTLDSKGYALFPATPADACSPIQNSKDLKEKIALIERGNCEFYVKAKAAEEAGAAGVIFYDDQAGAYFAADSNGESVTIPAGTIPRRIGQNLIAFIQAGEQISVTFDGPGPNDIGYENLASFSSQGPVGLDRRVKPDIVAPGTVASSSAGTACGTSIYGGTSMATPVTAGTALLVQQYFKEGYYPTGFSSPENGFMPSSALVKAVLMGGAKPIMGFEADTGLPIDPPPSFRQGFGRVFAGESLKLAGNPYAPTGFQVLDSIDINAGESHKYCVTSLGGLLSVTVAWTDYPGNPASTKALVNDLNLIVRAQGLNGAAILGNGGDIDDSSKPDSVNNVEGVYFTTLPAGRVSIEVVGQSISPSIGPQPYALAIIGEFEGTILPPSGAEVECPVVTAEIISEPPPLTNEKVIKFEFGIDGSTSTSVAFECSLQRGVDVVAGPAEWTSCSSPQEYQNLEDGEYTFGVRAAGEKSVAASTFIVDTTPPSTEINLSPSNPGIAAFSVTTNDRSPVTSQCQLSLQNGSPRQGTLFAGEVVANPINLGEWFDCSYSYIAMGWLLSGSWNFEIKSRDAAGNEGAIQSYPISIESNNGVHIIQGAFLTIPKSEVAFMLEATENNQVLTDADLECALQLWPDDLTPPGTVQEWKSCSTTQTYGADVMKGGKYTFSARFAGSNSNPYATSTFLVDETGPIVSITNNDAVYGTPDVTFQFEINEKSQLVECKLIGMDSEEDSVDWQPCDPPVEYQNLQGGKYVFQVKAVDMVGNKGKMTEQEFIVDLERPTITLDYPEGTQESSITVSFNVDDGIKGSGINTISCQVVPVRTADPVDPESAVLDRVDDCKSPWTIDGLTEGHWTFQINTTDNSGKQSIEKRDFWMDTEPPGAEIISGPDR